MKMATKKTGSTSGKKRSGFIDESGYVSKGNPYLKDDKKSTAKKTNKKK